jgi:DNA-directed RNA polymerase beta' subunit
MFSELAGPEKKCPHCGKDQQEITYSYPFFMEGEKWLTPTEVKARLERIGSIGIPREGGKWGFMRPEGMVLEVVLVHRDFLKETGGARTIANIIHTNIRLEQNLGAAPEFLIEDLWGLLHSWVDTYLMTLFNRYLLYLRGKLHEESRKIVKDFFFHTCLYLEPDLKI